MSTLHIKEKQVKLDNALDQKIYDACVNTLKLCMMEHYVDTPWREQCLYVYDSRNQALCGYKAFEGGNADYVRANLKLISQDRREDGTPTARTGKILVATPMKKFGEISDLIGTLMWLADDKASGFVTGTVIPVDGGFSAYSGV